ncbi:MAG: hypothetical protein ABSE73_11125 [Planctomycetota bacterium]
MQLRTLRASLARAWQLIAPRAGQSLRVRRSNPDANLAAHLRRHLDAYADLQMYLKMGAPIDKLPETRQLVSDAEELEAQLALLPQYPPLVMAREALRGHWRDLWTNGGVSETEYRARLKAALLFIEDYRAEGAAEEMAAGGELRTAFGHW